MNAKEKYEQTLKLLKGRDAYSDIKLIDDLEKRVGFLAHLVALLVSTSDLHINTVVHHLGELHRTGEATFESLTGKGEWTQHPPDWEHVWEQEEPDNG
jgi:lipopolysaccharide biosynthesis protein